MKTLTPKQIEVASEWWANALESPKFDNGDNSPAGGMSMALAMMGTKTHTPEKVASFKAFVADLLGKETETQYLNIGVDYHPDRLLEQALSKAGIQNSITILPWKTNMAFHNGGVQVACGYRAEPIELIKE